jgi:hypothetical protein
MPNYWKIAPGRQAAFWRECFENQCIAINWLNHLDLSKLSVEEIQLHLHDHEEGAAGSVRAIGAFVNSIQPGDLIFANSGKTRCKGIGTVTSNYLHPKHRKNPFRNQDYNAQVRLVDWQVDATVDLPAHFFNIPTVQPLSLKQVAQIKRAYIDQYPKLTPILDQLLHAGFDTSHSTPEPLNNDPQDPETSEFNPNDQDERTAILQSVKVRQGQAAFRNALLTHFQSRCAISGCTVVELLEAAHIHPYRGTKDHHIENGLLLRADLHTLFDLWLLAIHPKTFRVLLAPHVANDPDYQPLENQLVRFPKNLKPNAQALEARYREFLERS